MQTAAQPTLLPNPVLLMEDSGGSPKSQQKQQDSGQPSSPSFGKELDLVLLLHIRNILRSFFSKHPGIGVVCILGIVALVVDRLLFALQLATTAAKLCGLLARVAGRFILSCALGSAYLLALATRRRRAIGALGRETRFGKLTVDVDSNIIGRGAGWLENRLHRLGLSILSAPDRGATLSAVGGAVGRFLRDVHLTDAPWLVSLCRTLSIHNQGTRDLYWAGLVNAHRRTGDILDALDARGVRHFPGLWLAARTVYVTCRLVLALLCASFKGYGDKKQLSEAGRVALAILIFTPYSFDTQGPALVLAALTWVRLALGLPSAAASFTAFVWRSWRWSRA